ncbi:beta-lactamase regulating signal transducer with metallopeptidase domain [Halopolyspora algeriensis]|uniref:Beta-lactamase regulating signal transducer with metallopeptidase domain n=1 Tax=Halopolyspora algeriensis TaxID=1500506 RepID=A0A368VTD9_9ACTN|nr:M56 family metallopeptidase [Halopolyspora algeriensis]RCW44466.1 beta-lactamase regulating signal transducer with metallopeptidase domain [Halopolyspora algeriensis]TQM55827.1 beta-lactamase regulating signal transducer with metallopeptidase domain [Halopolyspora algeriensis]
MTVALGLLAAAVLIGVFGPMYLHRSVSPRIHPGSALTGWIASVLAVLATAAVGATLLSMPYASSTDGLIGMATACINTGQHFWETILRVSGITMVLGVALRTAFVAVRLRSQDSARRYRHLAALKFLGESDPGKRDSLFWLHEDTPVAYSVGGRQGAIVATTGITRLSTETQAAILAHERAHLRGRHHGLVLLVEVLARALPFVPLFRAAPPVVRVLAELSADAAAARSCGPDSVRAALRAVGGVSVPAAALAMSRQAVELRLRWLDPTREAPRNGMRHRAGYATAVLTSLSPAVLGIGLITGFVLLLCLSIGSPM